MQFDSSNSYAASRRFTTFTIIPREIPAKKNFAISFITALQCHIVWLCCERYAKIGNNVLTIAVRCMYSCFYTSIKQALFYSPSFSRPLFLCLVFYFSKTCHSSLYVHGLAHNTVLIKLVDMKFHN